MSNKKLHNRLKNLFDDLHDQAEQPQSGPDQTARPPEADGQVQDKPGTAAQPGDSPGGEAPGLEFRAGATAFTAPDLPAIPAPTWPRAGGHTFGFRADERQVMLATEALTPEGRESLITEAPVRRPAEDGRPAVLAVSIASERSVKPTQPDGGNASARLLLEILSTEDNREWSEDELLLVNQVADQLALALENARLFEQTAQRSEELNILRQVSMELAEEQRDLNAVMDVITLRAMELLAADGGGVWLWQSADQQLELLARYQNREPQLVRQRLQPGESLTGMAFFSRRTQILESGSSEQAFSENPSEQPQAALATPLIWQNEPVGVLTVTRAAAYSFTPDDVRLAELLAGQAATMIQNARLFQSTQQALAETASLYEASAAMNQAQSYDDIITYLRRYTVLGRMDLNLSLNLFDRTWQANEPPGWITSVAQWNPLAAGGGLRRPLEALPVANLLAPDAPLIIADIPADPRLNEQARRLYSERLPGRSAIFVPLVVAGKWIGYIHGLHRQTLDFESEAIKRLMALAGQAAVALQNLVQLHASQARAQREYLIREIGAQVSASLDMETIMKTTARSLSQAMGATHVAVRLTGAPAETENPGPAAPSAQPPAADNFGQEPEA